MAASSLARRQHISVRDEVVDSLARPEHSSGAQRPPKGVVSEKNLFSHHVQGAGTTGPGANTSPVDWMMSAGKRCTWDRSAYRKSLRYAC